MKRVWAETVRSRVKELILDAGGSVAVANDVAAATVSTSLMGVDSHGIALVPKIMDRAREGRCTLGATAELVSSSAVVVVIDAKLTPGQHATMVGVRAAVEMASHYGLGIATIRNSTHFGGATPYLLEIAHSNMMGFVGSNSLRSMAAFGCSSANLGNNPFGFIAPEETGRHFFFDFSSAVMSYGKRQHLRTKGVPIPAGVFIEVEGGLSAGVCEIASAPDHVALPFGAYKGASIAVMIELLAGILSGGNVGRSTETWEDGTFRGPSHFALAINPERFDVGDWKNAVTNYVRDLKGGVPGLRLPGDAAWVIRDERMAGGIPIPDELIKQLGLI